MPDAPQPDTAPDPHLEKVLVEYLDGSVCGTTDLDRWIEAHPEHDEDLRRFAENCAWMRGFAGAAPPVFGAVIAAERTDPFSADAAGADPADLSTTDAARYVDLAPHARGGLGEVFTAYDRELHRVVALKRIRSDHARDSRSQRHFLVEAEVTARLDHPGVVPVHSLFRDDADLPCYTMRFIEGQTLDDAINTHYAGPPEPVAFRRLLQSFIQVCETVAYAHSRGILHRDLKPQNIMLGKFGETIVVDWGLAKVVGRPAEESPNSPEGTLRLVGDSSLDRTAMGDAVGTPAYMSPEQAAGRWDVINAASDLYSLGAVLYAILTGGPPLRGDNWPEIQQKIQRGDFSHPRVVNPATPRALEAVCLRAMAMKPEDRYPSARALADELERWLAGEPVQAYPEPVADRLRRWAKRHQVLVTNGAFAIVVLIALTWGLSIMNAEARVTRQLKLNYQGELGRTSRAIDQALSRYARLDASAFRAIDQIAADLTRDPRWRRPESEDLRRHVSRRVVEFWDRALELDQTRDGKPGPRSRIYLRRRALSLARFGEHQQADAAVRTLLATAQAREQVGLAAHDYARIYALCTAAAVTDASIAARYSGRSMDFLREAEEAGFFNGSTRTTPLDADPDFVSLRPRADFRRLVASLPAAEPADGPASDQPAAPWIDAPRTLRQEP